MSPATALQDGSALAFPTRKQLEELGGYASAEAALSAARSKDVAPILPEIVHNDGSPAVVVPGSGEAPVLAPEMPANMRALPDA